MGGEEEVGVEESGELDEEDEEDENDGSDVSSSSEDEEEGTTFGLASLLVSGPRTRRNPKPNPRYQ